MTPHRLLDALRQARLWYAALALVASFPLKTVIDLRAHLAERQQFGAAATP